MSIMDNCEIYMGFDPYEEEAYEVAQFSIERRTFHCPDIKPLNLVDLNHLGLFYRKFGWKTKDGNLSLFNTSRTDVLWDKISGAPCSTEFAITRFLTPIISTKKWALFVDCDIVCLGDIEELFHYADDRYAVQVVKHKAPMQKYNQRLKMSGVPQMDYSRKNWSSVMLFNCIHPANRTRLDVEFVNKIPGKHLHNFCWLADHEIGELPCEWNYLVDVSQPCSYPKIMHYTLGGPWISGWEKKPSDDVWLSERDDLRDHLGSKEHQLSIPF